MPMPRFARGAPLSSTALNQLAEELDRQGLACKTRLTTTGTISPNTDYIVSWGKEDYDTFGGGMWSPPATNYQIVRYDGVYLLKAQLRLPPFSSGEAAGKILVNSTNVLSADSAAGPKASDKRPFSTSGEGVTLNLVTVEPLYAGDRIYTNVWHSGSAPLTWGQPDMGGTYLSCSRLSALS